MLARVVAACLLAACSVPELSFDCASASECGAGYDCVDRACVRTCVPTPLTEIVDLAVGDDHGCALTSTNRLYCWGSNDNGQIGAGTGRAFPYATAIELAAGETPQSIAAGARHTCALSDQGVQCWGDDRLRQLGVFTDGVIRLDQPTHVTLLDGTAVGALSLGSGHSCALEAGQVYCFGAAQLTGVETMVGSDEIRRGYVVRSDTGELLDGVIAIAAGDSHTCAATADSLWCWGQQPAALVGVQPPDEYSVATRIAPLASGLTALASGADHSCFASGTQVTCLGDNSQGQAVPGGDLEIVAELPLELGAPVTDLTARATHTCALADGVVCWGDNSDNELGTGPDDHGRHRIDAIPGAPSTVRAGASHTCVVANGIAWCVGRNDQGQLGDGSFVDRDQPVAVVTCE